jgi:acyl-CoA synthetase (AMP-forming)/AMP-acid ligase II
MTLQTQRTEGLHFQSFTEKINFWANTQGLKTAVVYVDDRGNELRRINYKELMAQVAFWAKELASCCKKGDRCLIIMSPGVEFVTGFLACLFSGVVAVAVHPPRKRRENLRFWSILKDSSPSVILLNNSTNNLIRLNRQKGG